MHVDPFASFSTKAIHLELISDLSAEAFIVVRLFFRKGKWSEIYNDCGTTFDGKKRKFIEFEKLAK